MGMAIWGAVCAIIGAFLSIICYIEGSSYEYALRVTYGNQSNWAEPLFYIGLVMAIVGILLLVVGLTMQSSNSTPPPTVNVSPTLSTPLYCIQCGEQILSGNFVCTMCHYDNASDFFLRSADPAGRAVEINHAWYKFGMDKRYPAKTKELASLVAQEQRQGVKNEIANRDFIARVTNIVKYTKTT